MKLSSKTCYSSTYCQCCIIAFFLSYNIQAIYSFVIPQIQHDTFTNKRLLSHSSSSLQLLSNEYLENDLVSIRPPAKFASIINNKNSNSNNKNDGQDDDLISPILCVVHPDSGIHPLCTHEDDNETDLFIHPKLAYLPWTDEEIQDEDIIELYGEGWYGQRVVPSLGGGPGYGASADDVWTVDVDLLNKVKNDGVVIPNLDLGIAHGEKARGGAI